MQTDIIQEAKDYWELCRGDRPMPSRADIDPIDIKRLLPNVILLDVLREPLNFRYRLIGTEIDAHSAENHTGELITDIPGRAPPSAVWDNLKSVVETRQPSERSVPYVGISKEFITTRQIILPLSENGTDVNMLFLVIAYVRK